MNNLTIVKKMYYYLGKAKNIKDIIHCMSRLWITVQRPAKLANNSKFLILKAKGIARNRKQIHIIFNTLSHVLGSLLKHVTETMHDQLSKQIISLAQAQIHSTNFDNGLLTLKLSKNTSLSPSAVALLEKQNISILSKPLQLEFTLSEPFDSERIENMLFL